MEHPLTQRLEQLRRRLRWRLIGYGASRVVMLLIGAAVLEGLADWASHRLRLGLFDDPGVRLICAAAIVGLVLWTAWRSLVRPLAVGWSDPDLALEVERRYPDLNDRLVSTVEFLRASDEDSQAGSASLRRAVIRQTLDHTQAIDFNEVLEWQPVRRAGLAAIAVILVATLIVSWHPSGASLGLARLVHPFGNYPWPKETHLQIVQYTRRVAEGESFETVVADKNNRLPSEGQIEYRLGDHRTISEPLRRIDGAYKARRESVQEPFQFRIVAGDDQTDWQSVSVVPPPAIERLQLKLIYPSYSGKDPELLPEGVGQVRALRGTEVLVEATASKPLRQAGLRFGSGLHLGASLVPSHQQIRANFTVSDSGSYWLALVDSEPEGFTNFRTATRYEIRAIPDLPPDVFIEEPSSHKRVTADAMVPLRVVVKDDLGIARSDLHYTRSDQPEQPATTIPLYQGLDRPLTEVMESFWSLAPLELTTGTIVTFHAEATDYDNISGPNVGKSHELRLEIVSPEELKRLLAENEALIRQELERLVKVQEQAHQTVEELRRQLQHAGQLAQRDIDNLQGTEMAQRHVSHGLTSPRDGVRGMIDRLLEDLDNNQIHDPETHERLESMADAITQLQRGPLPQIEQQLNRARKASLTDADQREPSPASPPDDEVPAKALAAADQHQEQVLDSLRRMLDELAEWQHYRSVAREVQELIQGQEQVRDRTAEVGKSTLAKNPEDLSPQERADLERTAGRQQTLADRLDRLTRQMEEFRRQLEQSDPTVAESFADALQQVREEAISTQMRQASQDLQGNRIGQALQAQQRSVESLEELRDILENRRERQLARLIQKLREAERELEEVRQQQAAHLDRTRQADQQEDPDERRDALQRLARRQDELQKQVQRLARQLQRLQAQRASQSGRQAATAMSQAGQALQQAESSLAQQAQQEALDQLQRAQNQLQQLRQELEEQLAMEQLARIGDRLAQTLQRQQALIEETQRLDQSRQEQGSWRRSQLLSLQDLARNQDILKAETDELKERLTAAPVFALALQGAVRNMQQAADRLQQRLTDDPTQRFQHRAAERFRQLLDALKPETAEGGQQSGGGGGGSGRQPRDGIPPLAQLKLLKTLQIEINQRTQELDDLRQSREELTSAQQSEFRALSQEQGTLADIARDLVQPVEPEEPLP